MRHALVEALMAVLKGGEGEGGLGDLQPRQSGGLQRQTSETPGHPRRGGTHGAAQVDLGALALHHGDGLSTKRQRSYWKGGRGREGEREG